MQLTSGPAPGDLIRPVLQFLVAAIAAASALLAACSGEDRGRTVEVTVLNEFGPCRTELQVDGKVVALDGSTRWTARIALPRGERVADHVSFWIAMPGGWRSVEASFQPGSDGTEALLRPENDRPAAILLVDSRLDRATSIQIGEFYASVPRNNVLIFPALDLPEAPESAVVVLGSKTIGHLPTRGAPDAAGLFVIDTSGAHRYLVSRIERDGDTRSVREQLEIEAGRFRASEMETDGIGRIDFVGSNLDLHGGGRWELEVADAPR